MKIRLVSSFFIIIGVAIGIILSLQVRANPVRFGTSPVDQLETRRALLATFTLQQEDLKKKLTAVDEKLHEAESIIAKRSSPQTLQILKHLKHLTGFDEVAGNGIRMILNDNINVTRVDFSSVNENFVQATDLRDMVNALFLKDAKAVAINGKRVLPLTPIQSIFDNILIGNFKISSPFVVEAIGNVDALKDAIQSIQKRKIRIFVDTDVTMRIESAESSKSVQFISL